MRVAGYAPARCERARRIVALADRPAAVQVLAVTAVAAHRLALPLVGEHASRLGRVVVLHLMRNVNDLVTQGMTKSANGPRPGWQTRLT